MFTTTCVKETDHFEGIGILKKFTIFICGATLLLLTGCQTMGGGVSAQNEINTASYQSELKMQEAKRCMDQYRVDYPTQAALISERLLQGDDDLQKYAKLTSKDSISDDYIQVFLEMSPIFAKCHALRSQATYIRDPGLGEANRVYMNELEKITLQLIQRKYSTYGEFATARYEAWLRVQERFTAVFAQLNERARVAQQIDINQRLQAAQSFSQGVNSGFNQMLQLQQTMNQNFQAQRQMQLQQQRMNQGTNCTTKYNPYSKSWDTVCR